MKKTICVLLTVLFLFGSALAQMDQTHSIAPADVDVKALQELCFGTDAQRIAETQREYGYSSFSLAASGGVPFCGYGPDSPATQLLQSRITIIRDADVAHQYGEVNSVIPGGVAPCGLSPEEARQIADGVMEKLGIDEPEYLFTTAYGRMKGTIPEYKITYLQRLGGLPVYWGSVEDEERQPLTNRIEVVIDGRNGELVVLQGYWSKFVPAEAPVALFDEEKACEVFRRVGISPAGIERCYFLTPAAGMKSRAIPAYRAGNNFIDAHTGQWLQLVSSPSYKP